MMLRKKKEVKIAFLRRSIGVFTTNVFSMVLAMLAGIIIARRLGPDLRGYYGLIIFSVSILVSFGQLGTPTAIVYFTGRSKYPKEEILTFILVASLSIGSLLAITFLILYPMIPGKWANINREIMLIGIASTPFFFLQNFVSRFLLSMMKVRQSNLVNLIRSSLYLILVLILLLLLKGDLKASVISYSASIITASLIAIFVFTKDIKPALRIRSELVRDAFKYGFKAYMINTLNFLNYRLDIFLIQHFLSTSELSFYQIAVGLSEKLWYIPNALSAILFPTLLMQKEFSTKLTEKVCRHSIFIMFIASIPVIIFARTLIALFYGNPYLPTVSALYSILLGIVLYPIFKFLTVDFAAREKLGIGIGASLAGVIVNLALNILLIPRYGIVGAGIATSVSYSLMSLILITTFTHVNKASLKDIILIKKEDFNDYRGLIKKLQNRPSTPQEAEKLPDNYT